ncbi:MAG: hypothetical protein AB8W78_12940 [Arsenophonus endosymbiont of Dermacentor nuttalli]
MNKFTLLLSLVFSFYSFFILAMTLNQLTLSEPNVLCDKHICADRIEGVSTRLTEKYLGKKQANCLLSQDVFDKTVFTFDNGVLYDIKGKKMSHMIDILMSKEKEQSLPAIHKKVI